MSYFSSAVELEGELAAVRKELDALEVSRREKNSPKTEARYKELCEKEDQLLLERHA